MSGKSKKLVVATSSRALFDLSKSDEVYRNEGIAAYAEYQIAREHEPLHPGDAFYLVRKLLQINTLLGIEDRVEVILLSRNTADTGLRVFNSIQHHQLAIKRAAFTGGSPPYRYMAPFQCDLFLSTHASDVTAALEMGAAAASILPSAKSEVESEVLKFAFDGDAVLFSDEAERLFQTSGLDAFAKSEQASADEPLGGGPFKSFLESLHDLQKEFSFENCPIRTALVTARAAPSHERVIKTLRDWDIRLDESLFLGGMPKAEFLQAYGTDVFFDDQPEHCQLTREVAPTGHVPHGVINSTEDH